MCHRTPLFLVFAACATSGSDGAHVDSQEQLSDQGRRLDAIESKLEAASVESRGAVQRLEAMIDLLQAEEESAPTVPGSLPPPAPKTNDELRDLARIAIGAGPPPVERDADKFSVEYQWLLHQLRSLSTQNQPPSVNPNRNGGLRLRGVRPGSLLSRLGFKNSDTLLSVNGAVVNTPEGLLRALETPTEAVQVVFQRRKEELTFTYVLR